MKQKFLVVVTLLFSICSFGQTIGDTFVENGINYIVTKATLPYEVAVGNNSSFVGVANIPASVTNAGNTFVVKSIGIEAFALCSGLNSVSIPNSVTSIGDYAFQNCIGLTSITVDWTTPIVIDTSVFDPINLSAVTLNVPFGRVEVYDAAPFWKDFNPITDGTVTPAPTATSQIVCRGDTVSDLQATGTDLKWYSLEVGGTVLLLTEILTSKTYYVSQTIVGIESSRTAVAVQLRAIPPPPGFGVNIAYFCNMATVADLVRGGDELYLSENGGTALASSTALVTGTTYYVKLKCFNSINPINVVITSPIPPMALSQTFCALATVANLVATGTELKWYATESGGTALTSDIALVSGIYYVTQTINGCESERTSVAVTINLNDIIIPIVVIKNITVELDSSGTASITASDINNGSTDNCGISSFSLSKSTFDCSNLGTNVVAFSVTDFSGNVSIAFAIVTIIDTTNPIVVTKNITVPLNSGATASINPSDIIDSSIDNCGISSYLLSESNFDITNLGSNTVTLTVTDSSGNVSIGTATVTISTNTQIPTALTFCQGAKVSDAVGTTSMKFYTALTGGSLLLNTATLTNRTVYATQTVNGTESTPRVPVVITINPLPTEVLGAITSNTVNALLTTGFDPATTKVGQYVKTTTPISYRIPAFTGAGLSYLWSVPAGVTIVGSVDTNVLTVHYNDVAAGAGIIGTFKVQAVNSNTCAGTAKSITVSKVLPTAPGSIKMTNAALPLPSSGVAAAITTFAPYMGTTTELTLTARPAATATSYVWELPTGVVVTNGSATTVGGVTESFSNEITVNFSGVTNTNTFNYMTTAAVPVSTNNLRIGVLSKNGTGLSTTSNAALVNSSPLFTPNNTSTARLLTLTAVSPVAPTSLKMYNPLVSTTVAVTDISKFIGTTTELTLTATVSRLASSYSWEIPSSVTIVAGSNLASNNIKVTFKNVPAGTASLYLGVKAVNGIGSSVTDNSALTTPATTSEARLLKVTAIAPSVVGTVTGSLRICPTTASDVVYSIATAATRANTYNITVPMGCTINGGTTNTATIVATAGATFTVNYPALFIANATTSIKKIFIQSENGFGVSTTDKSLSLTNVSAVCSPKLENSSTTPFEVIAYPNPSSSEFTIETSAKGAMSVKVYDMQGRLVENSNSTQVGSRLAAGVYNLIVTQDSKVKTLKVIKE